MKRKLEPILSIRWYTLRTRHYIHCLYGAHNATSFQTSKEHKIPTILDLYLSKLIKSLVPRFLLQSTDNQHSTLSNYISSEARFTS